MFMRLQHSIARKQPIMQGNLTVSAGAGAGFYALKILATSKSFTTRFGQGNRPWWSGFRYRDGGALTTVKTRPSRG